MTPWSRVGPRFALPGTREEESWAGFSPEQGRVLFFPKVFSNSLFSKPFANLVSILKLFENSNFLKIFKFLWNL
jgi:hypothetical protein